MGNFFPFKTGAGAINPPNTAPSSITVEVAVTRLMQVVNRFNRAGQYCEIALSHDIDS